MADYWSNFRFGAAIPKVRRNGTYLTLSLTLTITLTLLTLTVTVRVTLTLPTLPTLLTLIPDTFGMADRYQIFANDGERSVSLYRSRWG